MKLSPALLVTALICSLAAASAQGGTGETRRAQSDANSQLVINRAANFGNQSNISLYIDGNRVGTLGYRRRFKGTLPAGLHFVTIEADATFE